MEAGSIANESFVSPYKELIALECLYAEPNMTLKKITSETVLSGILPTEAFQNRYGMIPENDLIESVKNVVNDKIGSFSIVVNNTPGWPQKLAASTRPTPLLYYRGDLGLIESTSVSVVGSRKASDEGKSRARRIARELCDANITVVTGMAKGIDTEATTAAIESGGRVICVIGTPIDETYPKENADLQNRVALDHLLISQVPFYRYAEESFNSHRIRFPERNELMAAVSDATVIVEASDTSGTLSQARACLHQKRPLFIMRSLLENPEITWPAKYVEKEGVYVLDHTEQIFEKIEARND